MKSFEEQFVHEKNELTEALILFSEDKRVRKALADLEMNRPEFYKFYEAGQKSKQAEVDELQMKLSEDSRILHNVIDIERKKCEELQKRIDEALKELEYIHFYKTQNSNNAIKILKGDSHES